MLGLCDLDADEAPRAGIKRRRSSDVARLGADSCGDVDVAESGLMFNDLYLPPTPRMISSLEEEEEAWRIVDTQCKKQKISPSSSSATSATSAASASRPALRPCNSLTSSSSSSSSSASQNSSP